MKISINELMLTSGVQFGTSGVRGLATDMTDKVCYAYVTAFLQYLLNEQMVTSEASVCIAGDLRKSTPRIVKAAIKACRDMGLTPINMGSVPSPAVALYGMTHQMPSIMVTGSHIPDDRNGIKFNTPYAEILKQDEEGIRQQVVSIAEKDFMPDGAFTDDEISAVESEAAYNAYLQRFISFFPNNCLAGQQVGLYQHSSVSREIFKDILENLGASVTTLGRSETFISVDTEAIRPEDVTLAADWARQYAFDAIVSTDGDGDRPLVSDERGEWLRGDIAGMLCATYLDADTVVTPVSSNTALEKSQRFSNVIRTKIGSPYVIAAMQSAQSNSKSNHVVGYEANGGFLQQSAVVKDGQTLVALPTRDAVIVAISILMLSKQKDCSISELKSILPNRFTYSDRLKAFPTELSNSKLSTFVHDGKLEVQAFKMAFPDLPKAVSVDVTDGVRVTLENDDIVHLRPSGNAPELRCYTEASSIEMASKLNHSCMEAMRKWNA